MKRRILFTCLLASGLFASTLRAETRLIVRINGGINPLNTRCGLLGCTVAEAIGDPLGEVFLVTAGPIVGPTLQSLLCGAPGIIDCESDQPAQIASSHYTAPSALNNMVPSGYYGQNVPDGYLAQPATSIIRLFQGQSGFNVTGAGIVAVIDTGVDPNHPALRPVLMRGYDFTRNRPGADETPDYSYSTSPSPGSPNSVNPNAYANVDQSTAAVVDGNSMYSDFGHGTMVAGIIHLIAPSALILPLKAFKSNGTGYTSDILRAIYWAANSGSRIINMSFNLSAASAETKRAIQYANSLGIVCVAAAGNQGLEDMVYPAGYANLVMGIASTSNTDQLSSFSNYGAELVWAAAPGEGVVTTYPFGLWAAAWGTSFSTPMVSGTAALLLQMSLFCDQYCASSAIAHAVPLGQDLGNGRLDVYQALQAEATALGLQ